MGSRGSAQEGWQRYRGAWGGGTGQRQQVGERRDPELGYELAVTEPGTSP